MCLIFSGKDRMNEGQQSMLSVLLMEKRQIGSPSASCSKASRSKVAANFDVAACVFHLVNAKLRFIFSSAFIAISLVLICNKEDRKVHNAAAKKKNKDSACWLSTYRANLLIEVCDQLQ